MSLLLRMRHGFGYGVQPRRAILQLLLDELPDKHVNTERILRGDAEVAPAFEDVLRNVASDGFVRGGAVLGDGAGEDFFHPLRSHWNKAAFDVCVGVEALHGGGDFGHDTFVFSGEVGGNLLPLADGEGGNADASRRLCVAGEIGSNSKEREL